MFRLYEPLHMQKKEDADQLCGNRTADQCLCFRNTDSAIHLLPKSRISILQPYSVVEQHGLCRTWSETPKTGFHTTRPIFVDLSPSSTMISLTTIKSCGAILQNMIIYDCTYDHELSWLSMVFDH